MIDLFTIGFIKVSLIDIIDILLTYQITTRFIGEEYRSKEYTGKELCVDKGIEIYYNKRQHSFSTSELRKRINQA